MAKKKEPTTPLFSLKHDFVDSLDTVCSEGLMLIQAVEMAIRSGGIKDSVAEVLKERVASFRASLMSE